MTITVAMYQGSLDHIGPRLDALGLDLELIPIDDEGLCHVRGVPTAPEEVEVDYLWLSTHIHASRKLPVMFDVVERMKRIGVMQTFNAGLDHPVYARVAAKGTRICNSSAQGVAIAEYVFGQVMSVMQPIAEQRALQAAKTWKGTPFREIAGSNWVIVGYGPIGQETAKRLKAFDAHVSVVRRTRTMGENMDRVGVLDDLPGFLAEADVALLACPLKEDTRHLAGAAFFDAVKPGAIVVNVARGPVVDDDALIAALDDGRVSTAILDVFDVEPLPTEHPFWTHPGVRLTSHMSNAGSGGRGRWDRLFLDNIQRFAAGEELIKEVDPAEI